MPPLWMCGVCLRGCPPPSTGFPPPGKLIAVPRPELRGRPETLPGCGGDVARPGTVAPAPGPPGAGDGWLDGVAAVPYACEP